MIAEKYDTEIVAALAHEIKNPAALALAHVGLARLGIDDKKAVHQSLAHIEQALADITDLTQEMLFAAYGDAPFYDVYVSDMLKEMLAEYQSAWRNISFTLDTDVFTFYCRGQFLRLILSNLLKNAVEAVNYTSAEYPGHIVIVSELNGGVLKISIYNNGKHDMYKPYGNGLGLKICRQLAARMNGTVEVSFGKSGGCAAEITLSTTTA